ncbi:uncharacterized protein LAESUDRAFT_377366 [Laetiporus sulphureus 93-53]|uniref:Uncharacterized protein n=1 Tax=Laetiporus sulphureus 93-53 TaxID=1314785 RepID=A0A165CPM3_9APHY|nr:uncharacterized protein LAESUDRAFT_377366 [Laetiporus sulphureus 93-53]KZT03189.1 hypothetical protein LAESUDRAFT_377366 [Laetiporus sulphureus 93-53]
MMVLVSLHSHRIVTPCAASRQAGARPLAACPSLILRGYFSTWCPRHHGRSHAERLLHVGWSCASSSCGRDVMACWSSFSDGRWWLWRDGCLRGFSVSISSERSTGVRSVIVLLCAQDAIPRHGAARGTTGMMNSHFIRLLRQERTSTAERKRTPMPLPRHAHVSEQVSKPSCQPSASDSSSACPARSLRSYAAPASSCVVISISIVSLSPRAFSHGAAPARGSLVRFSFVTRALATHTLMELVLGRRWWKWRDGYWRVFQCLYRQNGFLCALMNACSRRDTHHATEPCVWSHRRNEIAFHTTSGGNARLVSQV